MSRLTDLILPVGSKISRGASFSGLIVAASLGLVLPASATPLTRTSAFTYDSSSGLLVKEIIEPGDSALCLVTEYVYDTYGNKTSATTRNCNGSAIPGVGSEAAAPTGDPVIAPRSSSTVYDPRGQFPLTMRNALWNSTTNPNQKEDRTYDARFGAIQTLTGPNGLTTSWAYDNFGRKTLETRADGTKTKWEYWYCTGINGGSANCPTIGGVAGAWVLVTTPLASDGTTQNGPIDKTYYDGLNREIRKETQGFDGTGTSTAVYQDTRYDSQGRPYQKSRPYYSGGTSYWTTLTFDSLNRVIVENRPDENLPNGANTSTAYNGLSVTVTNPKGQTRTTVKNSQGQVVKVTDANNQELTFAYDSFGNLTRTTDALGNQTILTYDFRGRKTGMQDPDMGTWTYDYNALGQLIRQTDPVGYAATPRYSTQMTYDLLGRLTQRSEADLVSNWYYDAYKNGSVCAKGIGKLCQAETDTGYSRIHSYDSLGRPSSTSTTLDATYTTGVTYDTQGRVATQSYPSGFTVKIGYTSLGYLKNLRNNVTDTPYWQAISQDAEEHLLTQSFGNNNVVTTQTYSAASGRLTGILAGAGNGVQNFTYHYDSLGNIDTRTDGNQQGLQETFTYDNLNRLETSTVNSGGAGQITKTYTYDALGNITSRSDLTVSAANGGYVYWPSGVGSVRPHAVSRINLLGGGHRTYGYDANGNLTEEKQYDAGNNEIASKGRTEVYTSFNMPKAMGRPGFSSSFYYGPEHQRVKQVSSSLGTTFYLNPGNNGELLYEKDLKPDSSIEERHFLTAGGQVVALVKRINGTTWSTRYLHRDSLGSTTAITDESGTVVERLAYEPFGKRRFPPGTDDPNNTITPQNTERGFTNHEHIDELGLIHMNGRIYDPVIGRFMSPDLLIEAPNDLQTYNRYAYTRNNPLIYSDPSGHCWTCVFEVMAWIIGGTEAAHQLGILDTSTTRMIQGITLAAGLAPVSGGISMGIGPVAQSMVAGFAGGFVGSNFNIESGIIGGITAGAFNLVGGIKGPFENILAHAAVGCASSSLSGGDCGSGALSGGFGAAATHFMPEGFKNNPVLAGAYVTVVGGTASVLGGGKFANGAQTAAFGYLFNHMASHADANLGTNEATTQASDTQEPMQLASRTDPLCRGDGVPVCGGGMGGGGASAPVGRGGNPLNVNPGTNSPATISGRDYSGHAIDRMQGRGVPPSAVENTIQTGTRTPGNQPGTTAHYDRVNNLTVITDTGSGRVVTIRQGAP